VALTGDQTGQDKADSLRLKGPLAASGPGDLGQAGEGPGGGQAGRRSAPPVPRAHFFWLFFLHAELQDPQIEKHGKTETKTDQDKKHVLKQQTEVQFVVFAYLAPTWTGLHGQNAARLRQ
jgi:hypothetical protein